MGEPAAPGHGREPLMPLLLETLIALAAAYLIGVGIAWFLFGCSKRDSYL